MVYAVWVVYMSESMILPRYTEDLMLQIEKEIKGIKEFADENKDILSNTQEPWEDIYCILEKELRNYEEIKEENTVYDVINNFRNNIDNYIQEALYCLKYNFRRSSKESCIVSEYEDDYWEEIKEYLFKEQRSKYDQDNADLIHNIKRIHGERNRYNADIEFEWEIKDENKLELAEDNFWILQVMLLVNDRFNDIFSTIKTELEEKIDNRHKKKRKKQYNFSVLNNLRLALLKVGNIVDNDDIDLYIWEKLTRMNMAVLLTNCSMKVKEKFDNYNLSAEEFIYEDEMVVGKRNVLYTKEAFDYDIRELAKNIGDTSCVLSVLVLIKNCFEFIIEHEEIILSEEVNKIKTELKNIYMKSVLNDTKSTEIILFYTKVILYLRNKCFKNNIDYQRREEKIRFELVDKEYQEFIKILYDGFDEQCWYQEVLDVMVYLGENIKSPVLEELKLQLKGNVQQDIIWLDFWFNNLTGRLSPKSVRMDFIGRIDDKKIREIFKKYNDEWEKIMLEKLKKHIQSNRWNTLEELESSLLKSGWYMKNSLLSNMEQDYSGEIYKDNEWMEIVNKILYNQGERSNEMRTFLEYNFNPYIYEECRTLLWYKRPEISLKEWEEEYKIIQKNLLYH